MIVGIDAGKYRTKFVYGQTAKNFLSAIYPYRELNVSNDNDDFLIEYEGKRYFGGDLGAREGYIPITYKDESKLHYTTLINALTALFHLRDTKYQIVVGSPISKRTEHEKQAIKDMLIGKHRIKINNVEKVIEIDKCEVAPEGAAAYYTMPIPNCQGLDFGSTTINYFYFSNGKIVSKLSGTFPIEDGVDKRAVMEGVQSQLSNKFEPERKTMLLGGLAAPYLPIVKEYYTNSFIVNNPQYATAHGCYLIARKIYEVHH